MTARGDRPEAIFLGEKDWELFLDTLGQVCEKTGWHLHVWMRGMQWFQNTCTGRFKQRYHICGHVFGSRHNAVVVESDRAVVPWITTRQTTRTGEK
jgi:putative transposase